MESLFTIGQLSKLFKVKISTLRYYDEVGLLKPARINPETHYRFYSTEQFERLNVIGYLRALDLSIDSIKEFFEARDISKLEEMLQEQKQQIQRQISSLKNIEQRIDARISQVGDAIHSNLNQIELISLKNIPIIYLNEDYRPNQDIEMPITTLRQKYGVDKNIFLGKIALILTSDKLQQRCFDDYSGLLLILEPGDDKDATGVLPAGKYLRLRFHGTHDTATTQYQKMIDYCQKHNYQITGDAVETALIDYGITDDLSKYVTEIRIPISED
ncbi:MerR family transcriptional regulator [Companilactobacillus kimchiensis]|uniref:Transcription regulator of multidrug-efflux transporter n=1 Tax=Companilactobacillus kimchiensis TaxID=993692 RepID=A0A0R2LIP7_9LACO|nr:MerR family transcriptional regulator [Companilactobacillus kimchiensis]KRN99194.1 transcription regulator of multidrug-efflux transporter [Companilactobacillus kimchiensis]